MNMRCEAESAFICTAGFSALPSRGVMSEAWKPGRHVRTASLYVTDLPYGQKANRGGYLRAAKQNKTEETEQHLSCLINEAVGQ